MKKICIIQPSLRQKGNTEILCKYLESHLNENNLEVFYIDLREREAELCDGRPLDAYSTQLQNDYEILKKSDVIIFGFPVYHFAITGVLKNFIDIMGDALTGKKIDFLVSAIYPDCDMSYEHILESLGAKYSVEKYTPGTVYVLNSGISNGKIMNQNELCKLDQLIEKINMLK